MRLVMYCQAAYPNWKPAVGTAEVWQEILDGVPYDTAKGYMKKHADQPFPPPIGLIAQEYAEANSDLPTLSAVLSLCTWWYRSTDDVTRYPTRVDREEYPFAVEVWQRMGGSAAMDDAEWAARNVERAYKQVRAESVDQMKIERIPELGAGSFMKQLGEKMKEIG
jgi:hypothetical protein